MIPKTIDSISPLEFLKRRDAFFSGDIAKFADVYGALLMEASLPEKIRKLQLGYMRWKSFSVLYERYIMAVGTFEIEEASQSYHISIMVTADTLMAGKVEDIANEFNIIQKIFINFTEEEASQILMDEKFRPEEEYLLESVEFSYIMQRITIPEEVAGITPFKVKEPFINPVHEEYMQNIYGQRKN